MNGSAPSPIPDADEVLANLPRDLSFTFDMDLASMLSMFGAAHLGMRHPAMVEGGIRDTVIGFTDHVCAALAGAGYEQLALLIRAGLEVNQ